MTIRGDVGDPGLQGEHGILLRLHRGRHGLLLDACGKHRLGVRLHRFPALLRLSDQFRTLLLDSGCAALLNGYVLAGQGNHRGRVAPPGAVKGGRTSALPAYRKRQADAVSGALEAGPFAAARARTTVSAPIPRPWRCFARHPPGGEFVL
jgi:hypothetical protein